MQLKTMHLKTNQRVVVTGYGAVCSLGENIDDIWNSILDYKIGYSVREFSDKTIGAKFFGFMEANKNRYKGLPKSILKMLPIFAKNAMVSARDAINMAFDDPEALAEYCAPFDFGVIIGTGWGGFDEAIVNHDSYKSTGLASSFATIVSMNNVATAAISMAWNARGYQNTTISACASGTMAIGDAYEIIRSGRAKVMLAGGSESLKGESNVWSIDVIQALSKEQSDATNACCPFSLGRSGFILSEGAAVLCLESYEGAVQRGATILGEITGYANYTDAYDMTAPAEDKKARVHVIEKALERAGRVPADIDYINAHGTSTPLNDLNETESIKKALGNHAYDLPVSSTKSYTGHLIGAAGAMESIFCLKTIATGLVPATIHFKEVDPACDLNYVPNKHLEEQNIDVALNLSFGFGGSNCAVIFERAT